MRAKYRSRATLPGRRGRKRCIKPTRVKTIMLPKLAGSRPVVGVEPAPVEAQRAAYDGDTAFHLYLREIGQTPLLTPQEEVELARKYLGEKPKETQWKRLTQALLMTNELVFVD